MKKDYQFERPHDKDGYVDGNKSISFDNKAMLRRKIRLEKYFKDAGIPIQLIGNPHKPAIIAGRALCLSAYVSNFNLNFTDKPFDGEIIYTVKLHNDTTPDIDQLYKVIMASTHRAVFRLRYDDTDLFLAGYNFVDKTTSYGKYPVFARTGEKIYFNDEFAQKIIDEFADKYRLVISQETINFDTLYKNIKNGKRKIHRENSRG